MTETGASRERRTARVVLALAALVFLGLRLPLLSLPLERDEGEYAYVAWRMQEGEVPYRDAFDQKPPGVFAAYLLGFAAFGRSTEAIHGLLALWCAGSAALLFAVSRRLAGELAAAFGVLVFVLLAADPSVGGTSANTEAFLLLPMLGSMAALLRGLEDGRARWWIACGALSAAACWFKQVAVVHALFAAVVALLARAPAGASRGGVAARRLAALALGGLAVSLPVFAAFAAADALPEFVDAVFLHNLEYTQRRSLAEGMAALRWNLARQAPGQALFWVLAAVALLRPGPAGPAPPVPVRALLGGWLAASLAGVAVGLQFRPHYFLQAAPAVAALAGVGLAGVARRVPLGSGGQAAVAAGLALLVLVPPLVAQRETFFADSPEAASRAIYGLNPFPEAPAIARYIARTSSPDERVLVVGSEPQILFHAERRSATRYIFFYPLTGAYPDSLERQREVLAEVREIRPRYVVWVQVATSLLESEDTQPWIFERLRELLARDFELELLARLDDLHEGYAFEVGRDAARWLRAQGDALDEQPWIAVYRRAR